MPFYLSNRITRSVNPTKQTAKCSILYSSSLRCCWTLHLFSLNTPPFVSAKVGSMRHPALWVRGSHQVGLALQQVLVLWIVSQPAEQGLAGIIPHTSVGQAHCQSHEGLEVVWVELQTPGWRQDPGTGEKRWFKVCTSKGNLDLTGINWDRPKPGNIRQRLMISGSGWMEPHLSCSSSAAGDQVCMVPSTAGLDDLH